MSMVDPRRPPTRPVVVRIDVNRPITVYGGSVLSRAVGLLTNEGQFLTNQGSFLTNGY
jgi:hypothetical protein